MVRPQRAASNGFAANRSLRRPRLSLHRRCRRGGEPV